MVCCLKRRYYLDELKQPHFLQAKVKCKKGVLNQPRLRRQLSAGELTASKFMHSFNAVYGEFLKHNLTLNKIFFQIQIDFASINGKTCPMPLKLALFGQHLSFVLCLSFLSIMNYQYLIYDGHTSYTSFISHSFSSLSILTFCR